MGDPAGSQGRFSGRSALVAGGSSGIGQAVATRLAGEGARVFIVGAPADADALETTLSELRDAGHDVAGAALDVAEVAGADAAVERATEHGAGLDILVVTVGFIRYPDPFLEASLETFERTFDVNVKATFLLGQRAARVMASRGGGVIINTSSTNSFMGDEHTAAFSAAKAAVSTLTQVMAIDLAPHGIRVNAIVPGMIRTRASAPMVENAEFWAKYRLKIPMDRAGDPAEIAALYAFIASDDASYMSGSVVTYDGGFSAGIRWRDWLELPDSSAPA
jgi:NAD(P)-dependent dehydrogenase (short-subunit alcohol dehydrogenase family)